MSAEDIARQFHDTYERLAPAHGWETQERSQVEWDDLPAENRALMVAVVADVVGPILADLAAARAEVMSHTTINGEPQTWRQMYERERATRERADKWGVLVSDLDRCEHGRHRADYCSSCGGPSAGNLLLPVGAVIGHGLDGTPIVVPERTRRSDPCSWRPPTDQGGDGHTATDAIGGPVRPSPAGGWERITPTDQGGADRVCPASGGRVPADAARPMPHRLLCPTCGRNVGIAGLAIIARHHRGVGA